MIWKLLQIVKTRRIHAVFAACVINIAAGILVGCASSNSWDMGGVERGTSIFVKDITVYKTGNMVSIEDEAAALLPVFLWENGVRAAYFEEDADFTADIQAHEREYQNGWKSRRSLSVTALLFDKEGALASAGRVYSSRGSLSDAETLQRLFGKAVRLAVRTIASQR